MSLPKIFSAGERLFAADLNSNFEYLEDGLDIAGAAVTGVDGKTANYTLVASDAGKLITMSNTAATTITIPTNASVAFPTGTIVYVSNINTGAVTIAGASGVTVSSTSGDRVLRRQFSAGMCIKTATDTWLFQHTTRDAGIGSNVVQAVKTDTFSNSFVVGSGIAQVEVTGLNVTITPSSTSSKVLVIATVSGSSSVRSGIIDVRLAKGGNAIGGALGNASGTNRFALTHRQSAIGNNGGDIAEATIVYLDSPGVASATTYSIFCVSPDDSSTQTVYINRSNTDTDSFSFRRTISTITAIEVAA